MAKQVQLRRGTTAALSSVTGAEGELFVDTTKDTLTVHDGYQAGGFPLLREDLNNLGANTIALSKLQHGSGSAGQIVAINDAANGLEFKNNRDITSPGQVINTTYYYNNNRYALSDSSDAVIFTTTFTKLKSAADSYILAQTVGAIYNSYSDFAGTYTDITTAVDSGWNHTTTDSKAFSGFARSDDGQQLNWALHKVFDYSALGAGTHTFELGWRVRSGGGSNKPGNVWNPNSSDDGRNHTRGFWLTFTEISK